MPETANLPPPKSSRRRGWSLLSRLAGAAAVILGGWCLWLGFPVTPKPLESEAFRDWSDPAASPMAPRTLQADDALPRQLATHITHVVDESELDLAEPGHVTTAGRSEEAIPDETGVAVISFTDEEETAAAEETEPAVTSQAGAWLTGTIEDGESLEADTPSGPVEFPAWKRSTKSTGSRSKDRNR